MECRLVGGSYIKTQTLYEEQIFNGWREAMLNDEGNVSLLKGYNAGNRSLLLQQQIRARHFPASISS